MAKQGRPKDPDKQCKPEYGELLINHMKEGLSIESFGAVVGVGKTQVFRWLNKKDDYFDENFSNARKIGDAHSLVFWEKIGRDLSTGKINGSAAAYIFNKKNRFGWRDQKETLNENQNIEIIVDQKK